MVRLAECVLFVAAVVVPTDATAHISTSHTISLGDQCLATTEKCELKRGNEETVAVECDLYNGAQVLLWDCNEDGYFKWFMTMDSSDLSQPFDIRAGNKLYSEGDSWSKQYSDWCLDAGDIDSDSSSLSIWECTGNPQQQFNLDYAYDVSAGRSYLGGISFPNGKCLDGTSPIATGNTPIAWECNGYDQQIWSVCTETKSCGPHGGVRQYYCTQDDCGGFQSPQSCTQGDCGGFQSAVV